MDKAKFQATHQWVKDELKRSVDFWLKNGMDAERGGVLYLPRPASGEVYSADKSVWMQGRCAAGSFAFLCSQLRQARRVAGAHQPQLPRTSWRSTASITSAGRTALLSPSLGDGKPAAPAPLLPLRELLYASPNAEYYADDRRHRRASSVPAGPMRWCATLNQRPYQGSHRLGAPRPIPETRSDAVRFGRSDDLSECHRPCMRRVRPREREAASTISALVSVWTPDHQVRTTKPELKLRAGDRRCPTAIRSRLDTTAGRVVNPGHDIEGSVVPGGAGQL